jgi:hypothetical protein
LENHVGLVLNGIRGTNEAGALMQRSAEGRGQIAFPFDAKVMAAGSETAKGHAVSRVCDMEQVWGWLGEGQVGANVGKVIGKFVGGGRGAGSSSSSSSSSRG